MRLVLSGLEYNSRHSLVTGGELLALREGAARLADASTVARMLKVERDWVYAHAQELGVIRLGGPRATALVAHLLAQGKSSNQIANQLGVAKSTVSYHLRRAGAQVGCAYVGRRVVCEVLGRSGVRASELCALRIGQVRLHDPDGARFRIPDAKTEAGVREVQLAPT